MTFHSFLQYRYHLNRVEVSPVSGDNITSPSPDDQQGTQKPVKLEGNEGRATVENKASAATRLHHPIKRGTWSNWASATSSPPPLMTADNRSVTSQLLKFSENVSLQGGRPREGNCRGIPVTKKKEHHRRQNFSKKLFLFQMLQLEGCRRWDLVYIFPLYSVFNFWYCLFLFI